MRLIPASALPSPVAIVMAALFDHARGRVTHRGARRWLGCQDPMCKLRPAPQPKSGRLACVHCDYKTSSGWHLRRHIDRVHHGKKWLREGEVKARR